MIYHIVEQSCYQRLTNGLAIPEIAKRLGVEYKTYSDYEFKSGFVDRDSSQEAIFITESAFLKSLHFGPYGLREYIPNGKLVNLGSDSILYNLYGQDEISRPDLFDLWLDTNQYSIDYYNNQGVKADLWRWTISEAYIQQIGNFVPNLFNCNKVKDYVCLARLNSPYRQELKQFLDQRGLTGTFGNGLISSELSDLYYLYNQAHICIGTTSPAGQDNFRTQKGFRDWISPFFGTVLVYDEHPEMDWCDSVVPKYSYNNFNDLVELIDDLTNNKENYYQYIVRQKQIILDYTLEKQFISLFKKHQII